MVAGLFYYEMPDTWFNYWEDLQEMDILIIELSKICFEAFQEESKPHETFVEEGKMDEK
ncbi:MAG: hypothetical protein ACHQET_01250 [Chitinophagales bacterium]